MFDHFLSSSFTAEGHKKMNAGFFSGCAGALASKNLTAKIASETLNMVNATYKLCKSVGNIFKQLFLNSNMLLFYRFSKYFEKAINT